MLAKSVYPFSARFDLVIPVAVIVFASPTNPIIPILAVTMPAVTMVLLNVVAALTALICPLT